MALAAIVMLEAAHSAREDRKANLAELKAINAAKQGLRELIRKVSRDVAANPPCPPAAQAMDFSRG